MCYLQIPIPSCTKLMGIVLLPLAQAAIIRATAASMYSDGPYIPLASCSEMLPPGKGHAIRRGAAKDGDERAEGPRESVNDRLLEGDSSAMALSVLLRFQSYMVCRTGGCRHTPANLHDKTCVASTTN
jgi:hypothetical protein